MTPNEDIDCIRIRNKRSKYIFPLVICICIFFALFVFIEAFHLPSKMNYFKDFLGFITALITMAIMVVAIVVFTINMIVNRDLLIIDLEGVTIRASLISPGFVAWDEIKSIEMVDCKGMQSIGIDVVDFEAFLSKQSFLMRRSINISLSYSDYPITLSFRYADESLENICSEMQEVFRFVRGLPMQE